MSGSASKVCSKCKVAQQLTCFTRLKKSSDGHGSHCKSCKKADYVQRKTKTKQQCAFKTCTQCSGTKSASSFPRKTDTKDGLAKLCKLCCQAACAIQYRTSEKIRANKADNLGERRIRNRRFLYAYLLDHPCERCHEGRPASLDFHHVDPSNKVHNVSLMVQRGYTLENINQEIAKCQVLCANCHRQDTAKQQGWYRDCMLP